MTITPTRVFVIAGMLTMSLLVVTCKVVASKPPPLQPPPPATPALQPPPPATPALIELYLGTPPSGTGPGASCGYVLMVEQWAFYHRPHVHVILVEEEIPSLRHAEGFLNLEVTSHMPHAAKLPSFAALNETWSRAIRGEIYGVLRFNVGRTRAADGEFMRAIGEDFQRIIRNSPARRESMFRRHANSYHRDQPKSLYAVLRAAMDDAMEEEFEHDREQLMDYTTALDNKTFRVEKGLGAEYLRMIRERARFPTPKWDDEHLWVKNASVYHSPPKRICVHLRKGDVVQYDKRRFTSLGPTGGIHDDDVIVLLRSLLQQFPDAVVHLHYNRPFDATKYVSAFRRIILHIDRPLTFEWPMFVAADILVISRSSYSEIPAFFNTRRVYYPSRLTFTPPHLGWTEYAADTPVETRG